jgi:hypothetical protein
MSFLINPYRYASEGGGGGGCTAPAAVYTGLAITQTTTSGCYRKPILTATSVSHSLADDTNLRFWVNCRLANTSTTFGAPACSSGSDLVAGKLFTYSQLQSGIDLLASDSTNAAAQDASDDIAVGWSVEVTACDISDCATSICADSLAQSLGAIETFPYNGAAVYDGSTFPAFNVDSGITLSATSGVGSLYAIQADVMPWYWSTSSSSGYDSLSGLTMTVELQYDLSCDTSGGCASYSWVDADDNGASITVSNGGTSQTFIVAEADCWSEDYIFVRARLKLEGSCGTTATSGWTTVGPAAGELETSWEGIKCFGGGGP